MDDFYREIRWFLEEAGICSHLTFIQVMVSRNGEKRNATVRVCNEILMVHEDSDERLLITNQVRRWTIGWVNGARRIIEEEV